MALDRPDLPFVLVVEDNPANLLLVQAVLRRAGFRTDEATSGEQALERISARQPELILMDLQLPGLDGITLTRMLKSDPATASITIVAVTAFAMEADRVRALAAGCEGFISKPIQTRTFVGELMSIVDRRRALDAKR